VFFRYAAIQVEAFNLLNAGQRVEFEGALGANDPQAVFIVKL
jgi:cold shock CspA family protein